MSSQIVVTAFGPVPIGPFLYGPGLHGKNPVRRIDDDAPSAWSEIVPGVFFKSVVCASGVRHIEALQIRFPIARPADVRGGHDGSGLRSRSRADGHRRRIGPVARIPSPLLAPEGAVCLFRLSLTDIFEKPVAICPPV